MMVLMVAMVETNDRGSGGGDGSGDGGNDDGGSKGGGDGFGCGVVVAYTLESYHA